MKCLNCTDDAYWYCDDPGSLPQAFCDKDLPGHLRARAYYGYLKTVAEVETPETFVQAAVEAPEAVAVSAEESVPKAKSRKRASKKAAAPEPAPEA